MARGTTTGDVLLQEKKLFLVFSSLAKLPPALVLLFATGRYSTIVYSNCFTVTLTIATKDGGGRTDEAEKP